MASLRRREKSQRLDIQRRAHDMLDTYLHRMFDAGVFSYPHVSKDIEDPNDNWIGFYPYEAPELSLPPELHIEHEAILVVQAMVELSDNETAVVKANIRSSRKNEQSVSKTNFAQFGSIPVELALYGGEQFDIPGYNATLLAERINKGIQDLV